MNALSPVEVIARLRGEGFTDDEVADEFARMGRMAIRRSGDGLEWVPGTAGTKQQRRVLGEWLARGRGLFRDDVTADEVRLERAKRMADGEAYGYDALARHFKCDASTIRRRLGVLRAK